MIFVEVLTFFDAAALLFFFSLHIFKSAIGALVQEHACSSDETLVSILLLCTRPEINCNFNGWPWAQITWDHRTGEFLVFFF